MRPSSVRVATAWRRKTVAMSISERNIARQRERVVEAALQRARLESLGMYVGLEGILQIQTREDIDRLAETFTVQTFYEAKILLGMLSDAKQKGGGPLTSDDLLRQVVENAETGDQCRLCDELLHELDGGDGEALGHEHNCPVAMAKELLDA